MELERATGPLHNPGLSTHILSLNASDNHRLPLAGFGSIGLLDETMASNTGRILQACIRGKASKGVKLANLRSWKILKRSYASSTLITKSPLADVPLPEDISLSNHLLEKMQSYKGDKVAMVCRFSLIHLHNLRCIFSQLQIFSHCQ